MGPALVLGCVLLCGAAEPTEAPAWSKPELKEMFAQAHQNFPPDVVNNELAKLGGRAYRVEPRAGEQAQAFAQRVVKLRQPNHPNIKKDQWVIALMRQFYADLAERCGTLARFERDANDTRFLKQCADEGRATAEEAAKGLEVVIEGLEGFMEPLPVVELSDPPKLLGAMAMVQRGIYVIENLERIRFENDQPPANAARTKRGALREIYAAQQQFNTSNKMIGMYEPKQREQVGHLRAAVPASYPTMYFNELIRGARESEMQHIHLLVMSKGNTLGELPLLLSKPAPPKKKPKKNAPPPPEVIEVHCSDAMTMQACATKIAEAKGRGLVLYVTE